jgi:PAT family beta-lactamase induction signal transducer AmpG
VRPLTAREGLIGALGFSSGLPLLLTGGTLSAWMTDAGLDLKTIGAMTLVSLPYAFKFLWAPLLDTYRLPFLGRRRGWMLTTQLAIASSLLGMAVFGPSAESPDPVPIAWLAVAVAFFSASQDIVLDGGEAIKGASPFSAYTNLPRADLKAMMSAMRPPKRS